MATKQFISLENLDLYDSLLKNYIAAEDAKSIKTVAIDGNVLKFYDVEEPVGSTAPKYAITLPQPDLSNFVQKVIEGSNGKALIFNEADGGGAKFEHKDGTLSFTGVNDGGENGITGQLYTVKKVDNKYIGTRLNMTLDGFYYTNGANSSAFTADDEIATKGDISAISDDDKTVYTTETSGGSQDNYAKKYSFYQGAEGSSQSPVASEKILDLYIPKDMVISEGTVVDIIFSNDKLWDGDVDVTEIIKGSETPTAADAGKYIRLTVANATNDRIYIKASDLVDVYTGGTTSETSVSIDNNNEITVDLITGGVAKTKLSSAVQDSLDLADSALQDSDIQPVDSEDIEDLFA